MSTQTRFCLNDEIARWRGQLLSNEGISEENVNELETHLRDTVTRLTAGELSEEEAFFVAVRRLGTPEKLTEEFAKDDPTAKWRTRIFWMAAALFVVRVSGTLITRLTVWLERPSATTKIFETETAQTWMQIVSIVRPFLLLTIMSVVGYGLLTGRMSRQADRIASLARSWKWRAALIFIPVLILTWFDVKLTWQEFHRLSPHSHTFINGIDASLSLVPSVLASFCWYTFLGVTLYLLAPGRRAKVAE